MMNRGVIPTEYMQHLTAELLLPHNEKYYQECLTYVENIELPQKEISKEEIIKLIVLQIREAQLDGKRAEQRLGSDPDIFVQKLICERQKLLPQNILLHKFQFPLYAFSLYILGYAFFIFLLAAWLEYTLPETLLTPVPFSSVGLLLGIFSLISAFVYLFYSRQRAHLVHAPRNQYTQTVERLNYLWIGFSFTIPYLLFRLQVTVFYIDLWLVFLIGALGVLLARQRFLATGTLPD